MNIQKYSLNILLTNQCNLNCISCDHYCGLHDNKWFISLEDLENNLIQAKKFLHNLHNIILIGGEPFLHPNIKEICILIRKYFPDIECSIGTNGIKLFSTNYADIEFITHQLNIDINISIYPIFLKQYDKLFNDLSQKKIPYSYQCSKVVFTKVTLDPAGKQQQQNSLDCMKVAHDFIFTLYKNKIYNCCISCCFDAFNFIEIENVDYINLSDIKNEQELFFLFNKKQSICKYCQSSGDGVILWHKTGDKNIIFKSSQDLFLYDYENYEYLKYDLSEVKDILHSKQFLKSIDPAFYKETKKVLSRYYSKKDIFLIIDSNKKLKNYREYLDNIYTLENIYIIFLNNNINTIEEYFQDFFNNNVKEKNNYFLFRVNNIQHYFDIIYKKSFGKQKIILKENI